MLVFEVTLLLRSHQHIRKCKDYLPEDLHLGVVTHLPQIGDIFLRPGLRDNVKFLPLYEFEHVVAVNKGECIGLTEDSKAFADGGGVGDSLLELLVEF